jgi:nickel-dependent lactate racemase
VENHDVNRTVSLGTTARGTPVEINKTVVESDFRIGTGFIEPHFFAGFSGGRKIIAPGVVSSCGVHANHGYKMIEHPCARAGIINGNPIHEDMVEQARMARLNFIVNVTLNKKSEITHVFAGDPEKAHEQGCEIERSLSTAYLERKVDTTIVSNGGAPLDLDLYQTCKGIDAASQITRDGGIIIMASTCSSGPGPQAFVDLHISECSPKAVLQKIRREEPIGVQWQNQILARTQMRQDIYLLSNLDEFIVRKMMIEPIHSIEDGVSKASRIIGQDIEIAVIPEGSYLLPKIISQ